MPIPTTLSVAGTGRDVKPAPELYFGKTKLLDKKDFTCVYPDPEYTTPGVNHKITVTGKGNFSGTRDVYFVISDNQHNLARAVITIVPADPSQKKIYYMNGFNAGELKVTVKFGNTVVPELYYAIVGFPDGVGRGDITVAATMLGNENGYYGYKNVSITSFADREMKNVAFTGFADSIAFRQSVINTNGGMIQNATLTYGSETLTEGRDYKVTYLNNKRAGIARATYTGMGRYSGTLIKAYTITPTTAEFNVLHYNWLNYVKGGITTPIISVTDQDGIEMKERTDYTIKIYNRSNLKPGTMLLDVVGVGNYLGHTASISIPITAGDLSKATMTLTDRKYAARGTLWQSPVKITDQNGRILTAGIDYERNVSYSYTGGGAVPAAGTTVTVTAVGKGDYAGSYLSGTYRIYEKDLTRLAFVIDDMKYTGSELRPLRGKQIHVYASPVDARAKKNEITDNIYEVVGYTSNIKTGVGRVTVRGLGDYGSTRMLTFRIVKPGY